MLLDVRTTSATLGISERSLWSLTKEKRIRAVRIGRRVLYDPTDIQNFIQSRKTDGEHH